MDEKVLWKVERKLRKEDMAKKIGKRKNEGTIRREKEEVERVVLGYKMKRKRIERGLGSIRGRGVRGLGTIRGQKEVTRHQYCVWCRPEFCLW